MGRESGELLFSYDALQRREVQLDVFGRVIPAEPDVLVGYRIARVGGHPVARRTDDALDRTIGAVLSLTPDELDAADEFELARRRRRRAVLPDGREVWVYVDEAAPAGAD